MRPDALARRDAAVARHHDFDVVAEPRERPRQGARHVGQAPGLGKRHRLRRHHQDPHPFELSPHSAPRPARHGRSARAAAVYDRPVPGPPTRSPRAESREITELRAVKTRHPELAGAVDMHLELLELQRRIQGRVPLPPLDFDPNAFQRHQLEGRPLLRFEQIPLDLTDLRLMVRQTADVLHRFDALDAQEFQLVHTLGRGDQLLEVAGRWYRARGGAGRAPAGAGVAPAPPLEPEPEVPEIVGPRAGAGDAPVPVALRRGAAAAARARRLDARALRALRRRAGSGDARCARAIVTWSAAAACCSGGSTPSPARFAATATAARITSFATSDGLYRVYGCDVCHRYLKAFDARRATRPLMPVLDGVAMLPLDAAAMQRGYSS